LDWAGFAAALFGLGSGGFGAALDWAGFVAALFSLGSGGFGAPLDCPGLGFVDINHLSFGSQNHLLYNTLGTLCTFKEPLSALYIKHSLDLKNTVGFFWDAAFFFKCS
jgi:hypothetical protein